MRIIEERKILRITEGMGYTPLDLFRICNAVWIHKGNSHPHAVLTSGKHSDGYINCNQVLRFPNLTGILVEKFIGENIGILNLGVDYVVSSSEAARPFGQELARQIGAISVFTEKDNKGNQIWKRFKISENAVVLQAEELITTLKTTKKVKYAVFQNNPNQNFKFLEKDRKTIVATLVHRPDNLSIEYSDYRVIPLIELEIHSWEPEYCPLCEVGSSVLKPKTHWQELTGEK